MKIAVSLDRYTPYSDAQSKFDIIEDAGKLKQFEALLEEIFGETIDEGTFNDYLRYEFEQICECLNIKEEDEDDEEDEELEESLVSSLNKKIDEALKV